MTRLEFHSVAHARRARMFFVSNLRHFLASGRRSSTLDCRPFRLSTYERQAALGPPSRSCCPSRTAGFGSSSAGLTLLEVLLALAILGGAMAAIGELMRIGTLNAEAARDLTTAQIICETKMSELGSGLSVPQAVAQTPIEDMQYQGEWFYSIAVEQVDQDGLISVMVTVEQNAELYARPARFSLVRWMIDPMSEETTTSET